MSVSRKSAGTCHGGRNWGTSRAVFVGRRRLQLCLVQGLAALALLGSVAGVARAAEPATPQTSIELTYDAPVGCGNREDVVRRVEQLLEGSDRAYEAVRATVAVRETRAGLRVNYDATRSGHSSKRELVVTDCAAAVEASALLLVLTLDPVLASSATVDGLATGPVDAEPAPSVEPAPEPTPASKPEPKVVAAPKSRLPEPRPIEDAPDALPSPSIVEGGWLGLGGELVTGVSPTVGRGLRLDLGTTAFGARFGIWGAYNWVSDHAVPELGPAANLRSQLMRLRAWGGPVFAAGITRFGPVLSLGVEHLRANVVGIARPAPGHSTWLSASAGGHLDVHFSSAVALRLQAAALLSLERPTFSVRRGPEVVLVYQPSPIGLEASGGLVWVWGSQ